MAAHNYQILIRRNPMDTLKDYKLPTCFPNGVLRLTAFVKYVSSKVNVKNRYAQEELAEHTKYVEDFVKELVENFGQYHPDGEREVLEIDPNIIGRGSSYEGTKILFPDEYDYVPIFRWSRDDAVCVKEVEKTCRLAGKGYGIINIKKGDLHKKLKDDVIPSIDILSSDIDTTLRYAIETFLEKKYKKHLIDLKKNLKRDTNKYEEGEVKIHNDTHGTCVWLRIGAPLCTTDIDLGFAVENMSVKHGRRVMVAEGVVECGECYGKHSDTYWTESIIEPSPGDANAHLSDNHCHLFLTLKYINHLMAEFLKTETSSYAYKNLLFKHQKSCKNQNVGQCFEDIVNQLFGKTQDGDIISYTYKELEELPDFKFPKRMIELPGLQESAGLLWIMHHVKHRVDTTWWDSLLQEDLKREDIKNGDKLYPLLEAIDQRETRYEYIKIEEEQPSSVVEESSSTQGMFLTEDDFKRLKMEIQQEVCSAVKESMSSYVKEMEDLKQEVHSLKAEVSSARDKPK